MESLSFKLLDEQSDLADSGAVEKGLLDYNEAHLGEINYQKLTIVVKNSRNDLIGGLVGSSLCGWVYVNTVWVADEYRHRGIGKKLMSLAEDEGRRRGCHHARLETSEAQAPGFYFKLGYSVFGVLDDYPKGLKLYFFQKTL
jgi:ribosomal protein S18 acetylase RimI-like enzyme